MTGETPVKDTPFVDVTGIPFEQLMALDDSVLGHALRVLAKEIANPQDAVAGHQSAI